MQWAESVKRLSLKLVDPSAIFRLISLFRKINAVFSLEDDLG